MIEGEDIARSDTAGCRQAGWDVADPYAVPRAAKFLALCVVASGLVGLRALWLWLNT